MSARAKSAQSKPARQKTRATAATTSGSGTETLFVAGCGRTWPVGGELARLPDLAYTEQAFAECPSCLHRVEPEAAHQEAASGTAKPFCTLRPKAAAHPFAGLASLLGEGQS